MNKENCSLNSAAHEDLCADIMTLSLADSGSRNKRKNLSLPGKKACLLVLIEVFDDE